MCMHTGRSASSHSPNTGSQCDGSCNDGRPSGVVFSTKHSALAPLSRQRRISSAASFGSQSCTITIGTNMSGSAAHHSSIRKSFHARTQWWASSLSLKLANRAPPNRGRVGKLTLA